MFSRSPVSRVELGSYALLVLGVLGDHLTTTYGLITQQTQENNPFALMLMQKGLWEITDLVLIVALIAMPYLLMRVVKKP